jgi:tetratricopeptide (TPR) repeat protein
MKICILNLIFLFLYFNGFSQTLTQEQKNIIIERVQGFDAAFQEYSGPKGDSDPDLYTQILNFKDGQDPQQGMANDLFNSTDTLSLDFMRYIDDIDLIYNYKLGVTYDNDNIKVLDCIQVKSTDTGNVSFAFVSVNKTLNYGEKKKTVTEIIAINLRNYKIPDVFFPYSKGLCYDQIRSLPANTDQPIIEQPVIPEKYKVAVQQANDFYTNGEYMLAKNQYELIIQKFPRDSQKNHLQDEVDLCNTDITNELYNKMMGRANFYYNKGIFTKAISFYNYALRYKPNDPDALAGIDKCKDLTNSVLIDQKIRSAELLETQGQSNYGTAFIMLTDVEPSDKLGSADYYFMVENLYQRNPVVMAEMNYSDDDCENYLNIYRYKLRLASNREKRAEVTADVLQLLGDIIISNNTSHTYVSSVNYYPTWVINNSYNNRPVAINPYRSGYTRTSSQNMNMYRNNVRTNYSPTPRGANGMPPVPGRQPVPNQTSTFNRPMPAQVPVKTGQQPANTPVIQTVKKPSFFSKLGGAILKNAQNVKNPKAPVKKTITKPTSSGN